MTIAEQSISDFRAVHPNIERSRSGTSAGSGGGSKKLSSKAIIAIIVHDIANGLLNRKKVDAALGNGDVLCKL